MKNNIYQYILATLVVLGFFALLSILAFTDIPKENKDLVNMLLGAWIASFTSVISYFFGSSLGSSKKDDAINNMKDGKNI
jgi:hypothetical protein